MNKTRASLYLLGATAVLVATLFVLPITPRVPVSTVLIERDSLVDTLSVMGTVGDKGERIYGAMTAGQVASVHVAAGDRVQKGDLLFRLDASAEEAALGELLLAIDGQAAVMAMMPQPLSALSVAALQTQTELKLQAKTLQSVIEQKSVRADCAGVVRQVYIRQGDLLPERTVAVLIGSEERELLATQRAQDFTRVGIGVSGIMRLGDRPIGVARVSGFTAPTYSEEMLSYVQTVRMDVEPTAELALGDQVHVELVLDSKADTPLDPLSAVSESGRIWVVREGKAYAETVDLTQRNTEWIAVGEELTGLPVVLAPDEARLKQGCAVKEQSP